MYELMCALEFLEFWGGTRLPVIPRMKAMNGKRVASVVSVESHEIGEDPARVPLSLRAKAKTSQP